MIDNQAMLRLVFAAAGATAHLVLALVALRAEGARSVRTAMLALTTLSAIGLMVDSPVGDVLARAQPTLDLSLRILAAGVPGSLWTAVVALFRDRDPPWSHWLPAFGLMAASAPAYLLDEFRLPFFWIWVLASIALVLHAMAVIVLTGRSDLVESRRRLRVVASGLCILGCAVLLLLLVTIVADVSRVPIAPWWPTTLRGLMAASAIAVVAMLLDPRRQLLRPESRTAPAVEIDADLLRSLEAEMTAGEVWRTEGLTLAALATRLHTPEYKLRRLINGRLGHRNFTEFVNGYRVEAAKALLADPHNRLNIAQVAYEVGFSSLAPFNRAFKEATGATPTQWRRSMLIET